MMHFLDIQRLRAFRIGDCRLAIDRTGFLKIARRGQASPVFGLVSLAGPLRAVLPAGAMRRARTGWLRIWRGCWMVNWEGGKTRVFWQWGRP
jgi:hypothetical protein